MYKLNPPQNFDLGPLSASLRLNTIIEELNKMSKDEQVLRRVKNKFLHLSAKSGMFEMVHNPDKNNKRTVISG